MKVANTKLARKCLELIRDIADRGRSSWDPGVVCWALQELSQVLLERTGTQERYFEPEGSLGTDDLKHLYEELDFVDSASQSMVAAHRCQ
jgi:hypothetical protein